MEGSIARYKYRYIFFLIHYLIKTFYDSEIRFKR